MQIHEIVMELFVNRYAFGLLVYHGHIHIENTTRSPWA
jgi:hypothetical protein